jgi:hypothetical protein
MKFKENIMNNSITDSDLHKIDPNDHHKIHRRGLHSKLPYSKPACIFLHQLSNKKDSVIDDGFLIIADGLYDLLVFFSKNHPATYNFKFVVTKEIIRYIPSEWRDHFFFYQYKSLDQIKPENVCLIIDYYEDVTHTEIIKKSIQAYLSKNKNLKKLALINYKSRENEQYHFKATSNNFDFFNCMIQDLSEHLFVPPDFFQTQHNLNSTKFYFIKERVEIGCSHLESDILNLSGQMADLYPEVTGKKITSFRTSPSCDVEILKLSDGPTGHSFIYEQLMQKLPKPDQEPTAQTAYNCKQLIQKIILDTI